MIEEWKIKASSIEKYLSGLRMIHIAQGLDIPSLREPIVKLILTGKKNWDNVREKLNDKNKRDPVTLEMMKYF